MTSSVELGSVDFSQEKSRFQVYVPTVTAANFDATVTAIDTVQAAVNGVVLQATSRRVLKAEDVPYGPASVDPVAQRESKWRVTFTDAVTPNGNGSFEIPCADLTLLLPGSGEMDTTAGAGLTLKNAIEANLVSRLGNAITVDKIIHVGRNI